MDNQKAMSEHPDDQIMVMIPLRAAKDMLKIMDNVWDEGPAHEGWKSARLEELLAMLEKVTAPYAILK